MRRAYRGSIAVCTAGWLLGRCERMRTRVMKTERVAIYADRPGIDKTSRRDKQPDQSRDRSDHD